MQLWYYNVLDARKLAHEVRGPIIRIGRDKQNDIVLDHPLVAKQAAVLMRQGDTWELTALQKSKVAIADLELFAGDRRPVTAQAEISIFPFKLVFDGPTGPAPMVDPRALLDDEVSSIIGRLHTELLDRMDLASAESRVDNEQFQLSIERNLEELARDDGLLEADRIALATHLAGYAVRGQLLEKASPDDKETAGLLATTRTWVRLVSTVPERERELARVVDKLYDQLELGSHNDLGKRMDTIDKQFWSLWDGLTTNMPPDTRGYLALRRLKREIKDIVFGYGPLEDLLRSANISEIMVVDRNRIYIEKNGVVENSGRRFISDAVTLAIIDRIVSKVGRRIDKSQPLVDARLTDGSRVNAVIPPIAVRGPCLTIRKFPARKLRVEDLIKRGTLSRSAASFLRAAVIAGKNILVSGGTGTGKTTLLNCLSDFIPDKERIVTIEDTVELQLAKEHVVQLETKQKNIEGAGGFSIRDLVKNALRMRPDRIVVGECRGAEALDMLQAMNTGHDGSMTTIHANNSRDVVLRLEVMVRMAADLPVDSIHRQIGSALDLIVQLQRAEDGRRRVMQISEVVGVEEDTDRVIIKDLYALAGTNNDTQLLPTGILPSFMEQLIERQLVELEMFYA